MKLAQVWHPSVFIQEELDERGWSLLDLAKKMPCRDELQPHKEFWVNYFTLEMYMSIGADNPRMELGTEMSRDLGFAFDVDPQMFLRLHESWKTGASA